MRLGRPRNWSLSDALRAEIKAAKPNGLDRRQAERLRLACLAADGTWTLDEMAHAIGRARSCVQRWLNTLTTKGLAALLQRKTSPGAPPSLTPTQQAKLRTEIGRGKHRTAKQIGAWIESEFGVKLKRTGIYYWLGKLEAVLRVPRPQHCRQDAQRSAEFRATLLAQLHAMGLPKERPIEIWVQDEGRHGLQSCTRRVYTLPGRKPIVPLQQEYHWFYTFAAINVGTGELQAAHWDSVELGITEKFLDQVAASNPQAHHVIIYDGAGFHMKAGVHTLPERVSVITLPPYSPELNPVEGLWNQMRNETCNQVFAKLGDLQAKIDAHLATIWARADQAQSLVHGWMRRLVNASSPNIIPTSN